MKTRIAIITALFSLVCATAVFAAPASVYKLLTDYRENPLGIDSPQPGFSWQILSSERGSRQTAYQVQVASSSKLLASGKPDMWNSGKVKSSQCVDIPYQGKKLSSRTKYFWRVRVWDQNDRVTSFSKPASFETALLDQNEWQAKWIAVELPGGNGYHSQFGQSTDDMKWVRVDLGKPSRFKTIKLYPARPFNWQRDEPGFGFPVRYRIEAADDADFKSPRTIADRTTQDQPNPGANPITVEVGDQVARYIRVVVTKLENPADTKPLFALVEMEVLDNEGKNIALGAPVTALDSIEEHGWSMRMLTDGDRISHNPGDISPIFRREFDVTKPIACARAYAAGLGYYELRLNGKKVGDRVLEPSRTTYDKRVEYSTYDITSMLAQGRNCAGAMLGHGWWNNPPRFLMRIVIDYTDGTSTALVTDGSWKWSPSPIVENSLYGGETYDATKEQSGWDKANFNDASWKPAQTVVMPRVTLSAENIQPIKVVETLSPKSISSPKPGIYVFDFGQNFSGWCRLSVTAAAGAKIVLKHAEMLYPDGTVNQENLRSARATDTYIPRGTGAEVYEPRFTYHGFRYVQVEGYPGKPSLDSIRGRVVCTSLEPRGTFECSSDLINQIQRNAWWGQRTNFHSIPTDCPQRDERQGWMGDAWMTSDAMCYNFNMPPAYSKFLRDIADNEREDGAVPDTVPHIWGSQPGDPMWSAAYPVILWNTYRHTGDKRLLEQHYDGVKRSVHLLAREAQDYIVTRNTYGDWIAIEGTPKDLISTGTFYWLAEIIADMADALGKREEAKSYHDLCSKIAAAFNAKFLDQTKNEYGNGSQFSNAFPLYLGIVPPENRSSVLGNLVSNVLEKRNGHLSTGFIGTPFLLDALVKGNRADVAYTIVTQKTFPGWGYMIDNGATTVWELWQLATGRGMNSHNHPALGFVSADFYRVLAGISPDSDKAGWEHFTVKPYIIGDLEWAKASVPTVRGTIISHWKLTASGASLSVTVPANTSATVYVPKVGRKQCKVTEGGVIIWNNDRFVPGDKGIKSARNAGDWISFEVGSGTYSFNLTAL